MACGRAQVIKIALLAGFLLILLNLFGGGSRFESSHRYKTPHTNKNALQWPKRTRSSSSFSSTKQQNASNTTYNNKTTHLSSNITSNNNSSTNVSSNFSTSTILPNVIIGGSGQLLSIINVNETDDGSISNQSNRTRLNDNSNRTDAKHNINNNSISKFESDNKLNINDALTLSRRNNTLPSPKHTQPDVNENEIKPTQRISFDGEQQRGGFIETLMNTFGINTCPQIPPDLDGPIEVDTLYEKLAIVEARLGPKLKLGGLYRPSECTPRFRVAIIVPYRDREQHLPVFLKNLHVFLMKQQIEYGIFIIEQSSGSLFNRASLMNVGFVEALKMHDWDCFVFHDVDLLPMDDRNLYTCPDQPRHLSVAVDTFSFKLPYSSIFGGVSAMTVKQFRTVNGFSNQFWGWGGEDDDMSNRLKHVGFHIARYPMNIARYTMLSHNKEKANPKRYEKLVNGAKRFESDGLNSLKYKVLSLKKKKLYTWIHVELVQESAS